MIFVLMVFFWIENGRIRREQVRESEDEEILIKYRDIFKSFFCIL